MRGIFDRGQRCRRLEPEEASDLNFKSAYYIVSEGKRES